MRSLKGTLYRGVITGTAAVLFVAGIILYLSVESQLLRQMDSSLTDKARMLGSSVEEKHYGLEVDIEEMRAEEMEEAESPEYISIGTLDGRVIYRSEGLQGLPVSRFTGPLPEAEHAWHSAPDGVRLRSVVFSFLPAEDDEEEDLEIALADTGIVVDDLAQPGDPVVIQLFRDASEHERFMEIFLLMLLAAWLGSIGVLSLTVWMTIKKGAEPINEMATRIEAIGDDHLSVRLDETRGMRELAPILHKFNLFLDRLERSFTRERGFTSDAAHELRTPLAGLKSTIEVALSREREGREYRETLESAHEIVIQLENLVQSLLALARLESGQETVTGSEIPLESFVRAAWTSSSDAAERKHLKTSLDISNGSKAVLDGHLFSQVLEELFRNAVSYTDEGGTVRVDLKHHDPGRVMLTISNTGSKVSSDEADRVFDRFWRGAHSRDDTGVRFGLGLPIVRKIVETMGADMNVQTELDGEFVVTIIIPA